MSNAKETKVEDHDYSLQPVPQFARRRLLTMFMIMLGFTFFSALCSSCSAFRPSRHTAHQ